MGFGWVGMKREEMSDREKKGFICLKDYISSPLTEEYFAINDWNLRNALV